MSNELYLRDKSSEQRLFARRAWVLCLFMFTGFAILVGRLVYLQVVQYERFATISEENRIQIQPIPPTRGLIFDRNGVLLAENVPVFSLTIVPELSADLDLLLADLTDLVDLSADEIAGFRKRLRRRHRPYEPVAVRVAMSDTDIALVSVHQHRLAGVDVAARPLRHYPFADLTAHAIGSVRRITETDLTGLDPVRYAGADFMGKLGIERHYEEFLLGEVGHERVEVDARGRIRNRIAIEPPTAGVDLTLSMDIRLQAAAKAALGARRGAVVVLDPSDGGVLALVSNPGYDPNLFVRGIDSKTYDGLRRSKDTPLFNRAIRGQYSPGSTFKPFVGLAALQHGTVDWEKTVNDPGWFRLPNSRRLYRDWSWKKAGGGGHGQVNLSKALYRSSNVYFYHVANEMGIEPIHALASQFGFGRVTSVDLPEALPGLLPDPTWKRERHRRPWYPGDTVNMGIGQGFLLATPLQLATAVSVVANRGVFRRPHLLQHFGAPTPGEEGTDDNLEDQSGAARVIARADNRQRGRMDSMPGTVPPGYDPPADIAPVTEVPLGHYRRLLLAMESVVHRNAGYDEAGTAYSYIGRDMAYRMAGKSGTAQVVGIRQGEEYNAEELAERQRKHAWFIAVAPVDDPQLAIAVLVENGGSGSEVGAPVAREVADAWLLGIQQGRRLGRQGPAPAPVEEPATLEGVEVAQQ